MWHSTFDYRTVECKTLCHDTIRTDLSPRWSIHQPGHYIPRSFYCRSVSCKRSKVSFPVDSTLKHTKSSSMIELQQTPIFKDRPRQFQYHSYLQPKGDNDSASPVVCYCYRCKEKSQTNDGGNRLVDESPRFTVGSVLYIERHRPCRRCCHSERDRMTRWVPIDDTPSITEKALRDFDKHHRQLDIETRLIVLRQMKAMTKKPRGQA